MDILILGNGFDLSHGLPTSWQDFKGELENKNENSQYVELNKMINKYELNEKYELWADVENALGKLWNDKEPEEIDRFLDLFTQCFQNYLVENVNKKLEKVNHPKLVTFFKSFDHIINFNYTDTLKKVYGITENVHHIHGKVNEKTLNQSHIIIGCDENTEHCTIDTYNGAIGISKPNLNSRKIFNKFIGGMEQAGNYEEIYDLFTPDDHGLGAYFKQEDYNEINIWTWGFSFSNADKHFIEKVLGYPNIKLKKVYSYKPGNEEFPQSDVNILEKFEIKKSKAYQILKYSEELI